jgi:AcrR family transcriptional regulator
MKEKTAATIGRPRSFDRAAALQTALDLFWRHGYEGVSIADLTHAMGIAPPSLYGAFGSKAGLYREALALYQQRPTGSPIQVFQQDGPLREKVEALLRNSVRVATDPDHPPGCMITTGLLHCGSDTDALADIIAEIRATRCAAITARLERAITVGDLPAGSDAPGLARYLCAVMQGICIQARDGASAAELHALVDVTMENWRG